MAEESDSLKDEMNALLRADLERAREKRVAEPASPPEPVAEPPEVRAGLLRRLLG